MDNIKMCSKCGKENDIVSHFCSNCGSGLTQINNQNNVEQNVNTNIVSNSQINTNSNDLEANKLGVISLLLFFAGSSIVSLISFFLPDILKNFFSIFSGLFPLSGIIVMILGRVKYPNNKLLKVVMWVIIGSIIVWLILIILFFIWCYGACSNATPIGGN